MGRQFLISPYNSTKDYYSDEIICNDFPQTTNSIYWSDITSVDGFPGYGSWKWSDLEDLQLYFYAVCGISGSSWNVNVDNLYLRITYSDQPLPFYGLECWNSAGEQTLKVTDRLTRVIYKQEVAADDDGSTTISGNVSRMFAFAYGLNASSKGICHSVVLDPTSETEVTLYWTAKGSSPYAPSIDSLVIVLGW
jgi:hypothetical protein